MERQQLIDATTIIKNIPVYDGMKVADLGCGGAGHFIMPSSKHVGVRGEVYAVDILKSVLTSIESLKTLHQLHNVFTLWSNIEHYGATPLPDNYLDVVMLVNTLFLCKNKESALREAVRILRPGGLLLVVDWKKLNAIIETAGNRSDSLIIGPPDTYRISDKKIKEYAHDLSLSIVNQFMASKFHYAIIFKKEK